MSIQENPFTPSFGEIPLYLAGRDQFISEFTRALDKQSRSPELTTLVSGARGTGKTALLAKAAEEAQGHGWISVSVTCAPGMLHDILTQATRAASEFVPSPESKRITQVGIGQVIDIAWEHEETMPTNWRSKMDDLLEALTPSGTGLLITVDEVRPEVDEMINLAAVYQHFMSERKRVALLMAGLPFNVESLREDKTVSFVRRAEIQRLGRVADIEIEDALLKTIAQGGRTAEPRAIESMVEAIGGFPFMMQLTGYRTWNRNPDAPKITLADASHGIALAEEELRDRVFEPTYRELSDGDLAFLFALIDDVGGSSMADVADRMGKSSGYVNTYRRRLLKQGVIGEHTRKKLTIDLPMFKEFLLEKRSES